MTRHLLHMSIWLMRLDRWLALLYTAFGRVDPHGRFDPPLHHRVTSIIRTRRGRKDRNSAGASR